NPLTSNTTFTFQCTGPGGTSPLQSVTVNVGAPSSCSATTVSQCSLPTTSSGGSAGSCASGSTGSCNYSCSNGSWSPNSNSCATITTCNLPWGGTITNGVSVTAFQSATVQSPATCVSQTRTCNTGTLSGSYTHGTCTVLTPTATISVSPSRVLVNGTTGVSWSTSDVTACTVTGTNGFFSTSLTGTNVPSGVLKSQTTFTISCDGASASATTVVNVVPNFQEF
ncbi:MAG TPA: hypothetical protein VMV38_02270, partial [Candidatus Paceibacterota bacterium]|nr:hypothetical protein [Candidatus Paceibacterota bacterium]